MFRIPSSAQPRGAQEQTTWPSFEPRTRGYLGPCSYRQSCGESPLSLRASSSLYCSSACLTGIFSKQGLGFYWQCDLSETHAPNLSLRADVQGLLPASVKYETVKVWFACQGCICQSWLAQQEVQVISHDDFLPFLFVWPS